MIRSFGDRETERLFLREYSRRIPAHLHRIAVRKLHMLHYSTSLRDLRTPRSNRLEVLRGDRKGQFSIRVNVQFRICFAWRDGDAFGVEIVDYH